MATPQSSTDLVVDLTQRLDQALRRADLLERRIAAWEKELAAVKAELRDFTGQAALATQESDRVTGLEQRLHKLEARSLQAAARDALNAPAARPLEPLKPVLKLSPDREDHCALVFARWQPLEAKAGEKSCEDVLKIVRTVPTWAAGCPINAECEKVERYKK